MAFLRWLGSVLFPVVLLVAAVGGAGYWLYRDVQQPGPLSETRRLVIPPHSGVAAIADLLAAEGVVRRPLEFQLAARLSGRPLKPGEYDFPAGVSTLQTFDILAGGKTVKHKLTIPEGLTSSEIVALVQNAPVLDG